MVYHQELHKGRRQSYAIITVMGWSISDRPVCNHVGTHHSGQAHVAVSREGLEILASLRSVHLNRW